MTPAPPTPNETGPDGRPPEKSRGASMGVAATVLVIASVAIVFAAGLSLGGGIGGRDAEERADLQAIADAYRTITDDFVGSADPEALKDAAIRAMFETLGDPYSRFMSGDEFDATLSDISGQFEGIGARMTTETDLGDRCEPIDSTCRLRVTEVLTDSPAESAGLLADDVVLAVDEHDLEALTIDDAVLLIRGPRGSEVVLGIDRAGEASSVAITRDVIRSQDVRSATLADGDVGFLRIDSFSGNADEDFRDQLEAHLDAGTAGIIIDVRGDPGGFVDTAISIASQFIASGPILWEENADGDRRSFDADPGGVATDTDLDIVVLIDGGSASASEILAGALRDDERATLVGEPTFGKGTVQEWTQLAGQNGGFRLSVAKWLTRDQEWIDGDGIAPDITVAAGGRAYRPGDDVRPEDDPQVARALEVLADAGRPGSITDPAFPDGTPASTPAGPSPS